MDDEGLRRLLDETERAGGLATWVWDPAVTGTPWSAGMRRLMEVPEGVYDHEAFFSRVHPEDRARVLQAWAGTLETGDVPSLEFRLQLPSGRVVHVRGGGVALHAPGAPPRLLGTLVDVTKTVTLEREVAEAEKSRAVARLAAGVAHDLGNWLTVVRHGADQLGEAHPVRVDLERALAPCFSLTRELLALAQERPSETRLVDVRERIRSIAPVLRAVLSPDTKLEVACDEHLWVAIDPSHLEGVLLNLSVNARDAMSGRGTLRLAARASGDQAVLEVSDDGHGISPERLPRVFDPYFTTKPVGRGHGLGLASVRGTVLQHGGEVSVRSHAGAGTTFEIRLPRRAAPRILVVDDLTEVREVLCEVLRRAGMVVVEAGDGEEALEVLDEAGADLVLTDLVMPGMDGEALLERLLERGGPPVVAVTGYGSERVASRVPVVRKPFRPAEILDAVGRALVRRASGDRRPR